MPTDATPKLKGTDNQRAFLSILDPYDILPANYLHAALGKEARAEQLITLCKATGHLQLYDYEHKYKFVLPRLLEYGPKAAELGFTQKRVREHTEHKWARCVSKFSFEHSGFRLQRFDVPHFDVDGYQLRPDIPIFGLESEHRKFFLVGEIDRGTETREPDEDNDNASRKKNVLQMVQRYESFMRQGLYREYGVPNIAVFIIATDRKGAAPGTNMRSIARVIEHHVDPHYWPNFLLTSIPDFEIVGTPLEYKPGGSIVRLQPPPPTDHMVTRGWLRVGENEPFIIADFLERRSQWTSKSSKTSSGRERPSTGTSATL